MNSSKVSVKKCTFQKIIDVEECRPVQLNVGMLTPLEGDFMNYSKISIGKVVFSTKLIEKKISINLPK